MKTRLMSKKSLSIFIILLSLAVLTISATMFVKAEMGGFIAGGLGNASVEKNGDITTIKAASGTDFSAVKTDIGYGINGIEIPFGIQSESINAEYFAVMLSSSKAYYMQTKAFGLYFVPNGAQSATVKFASYNDVALTFAGEAAVNFLWNGDNKVKFVVQETYNASGFEGIWEIYVNDIKVEGIDFNASLCAVQNSFSGGYGYANFAYKGSSVVSVQAKTIVAAQQRVYTELAKGNLANTANVWQTSFAAGLNAPVKGGYNRGGYFEMMPMNTGGTFTAYKSDRTYTLDGIETSFDFYSEKGATSDLRFMYSKGSIFRFGFFIKKNIDPSKADLTYYGGGAEVGTITVPFDFDGTNVIKLDKGDEDKIWRVYVNGESFLSDCTSIIEKDVMTLFENQQANVYIWDADSSATNRFAVRKIDAKKFAEAPSGWQKGDVEGTIFDISGSGNVVVSSEADGAFTAIKTNQQYNINKFTHAFQLRKSILDTNELKIALSSDKEWYKQGSAIILSVKFKEKISAYNLFELSISTYKNHALTTLAAAQTTKFYINAANIIAFGKTMDGWALRLNGNDLELSADITPALNAFAREFTDSKCTLQIESTVGVKTEYEFMNVNTVFAKLTYPYNWVPGKAGGSDFGEPLVEGEEILISPKAKAEFSGIKTDKKVPLDGFKIDFNLDRPKGDDGKIFALIIASQAAWYQDCQSVMLVFRPQGLDGGVKNKAGLSLAYSDILTGKDLEGDYSKGGTKKSIPFNWDGNNTVELKLVDEEWNIYVNDAAYSSPISTELAVSGKINFIKDKFANGNGYFQVWNGEAFTSFTINQMNFVSPPKMPPIIKGSYNFTNATKGEKITIDLSKLFYDDEGVSLVYTANKGEINGMIWSYSPTENLAFVTITATNEMFSELKAEYLVIIDTAAVKPPASKAGCKGIVTGGSTVMALLLLGVGAALTIRTKDKKRK